jgi:hypothetical protein
VVSDIWSWEFSHARHPHPAVMALHIADLESSFLAEERGSDE